MGDVIPWGEGADHVYGWKLLITWLAFGAVLNALQLVLHSFVADLRKQPCSRIIIWLSSIDLSFDVLCLIQCSLNLHFRRFFGETLFCTMQAFWADV